MYVCQAVSIFKEIVGVFVVWQSLDMIYFGPATRFHHPTYTVSSLRKGLCLIHLCSQYLMLRLELTSYDLKKPTLSNIPFDGRGKVI